MDLAKNLDRIRTDIRVACAKRNRPPDAVRLIAVSKTVDAETVRKAWEAGQTRFGENRPQELENKATALPEGIEWHFIGHLQKNKVRTVVRHAAWIHSVDSASLLKRIDRIASEEGVRPKVLMQINIAAEDSKFGVQPEDIHDLVREAGDCEHLDCRGLMTILPYGLPPDALFGLFTALAVLRESTQKLLNVPLPDLSMGMSGDFREAISAGATLVRIGSAIFGEQP